ncbi:type I phosphodiesterase / nucleotide pyrophosphatase [Ancylostoma ceylanicum]|uniref:Type I phosphodiesterase / nucleotide pyrophosphatase n=1 Tax=Ancylostoma ceylanicum TaxID=53326 RepID=A0A0D6M7F6_9BILA|nr:type I phosphodiesterase / nucleotide pyrophosphatase [Ancylostoma ceylanicum]
MCSRFIETVSRHQIKNTSFPGRQDVSAARFRHLYILVAILLVMVLIGVIVTAVVAVRLGHMEKQVERAQAQLPRNVKEALDNFKLPMTWQFLPQSTAPPNVPPIQAEVHEPQPQPKEQQQYQRTKECRTECLRKDISKPPLVILSLDGFAREYLDRFTVGALEYMTKCGATAERVYPPFPSRTFPSHYTMVTGLYPESHGIVDNNIFDPSISDKMESMKRGNVDAFYLGDPVRNKTFSRQGTLGFQDIITLRSSITGLRPDISPPYNKDLPFRNRFDMIVDWLLMPPETCPGLITAYLDQPDSAGHYQIDDKDIEFQLAILDTNLRYLMDRLDDKGLLGCINLVIVSDHGMQKTNNTHYFSNIIKDPGIIPASGVIGRIHKHRSRMLLFSFRYPTI